MISQTFVLKKTADGSPTLYSPQMQESYHSMNGALQESKHVFIEAGLMRIPRRNIRIFEVGFGTGLNALLTWDFARQYDRTIRYDAIEAFPVSEELLLALDYQLLFQNLPADAFGSLHRAKWGSIQSMDSFFNLKKIQGDFTSYSFTDEYDLVYFDAFAPDKQPDLWEEGLFQNVFAALSPQGVLVTYCAKGEVRRRMQRVGFQVERLPGPPGKREMLRAVKRV